MVKSVESVPILAGSQTYVVSLQDAVAPEDELPSNLPHSRTARYVQEYQGLRNPLLRPSKR